MIKRCQPGRKNVMHSAIDLRIESVGPNAEQSRLWPYWHTKRPPLGWRSDGSPSTKPGTKHPHAVRPKIAEDVLARLINGTRVTKSRRLRSATALRYARNATTRRSQTACSRSVNPRLS